MFRNNPDFVITVTRDFVKSCQTPILVLPDDTAGHSLAAAIESAMLAPKGQLTCTPGKTRRRRFRWRCATFAASCCRIGRLRA